MEHKWYIIHTTPNYENKVQERLLAKITEKSLEAYFGRILIPTEDVEAVKNGKKVVAQKKLFSGYIFAEIAMDENIQYIVRKIANVTGFVGGANKAPSPVPERQMKQILEQVENPKGKPKPKVVFDRNSMVRVKSGPFADFNGVVDAVDYEKGRLRVLVTVFGRDTPVEISFEDVEVAA